MGKTSRLLARVGDRPLVRLLVIALALAATTVAATIVVRLLVPPAPSPLHDWILLKNALLPILLLLVYATAVQRLEQRPATETAIRPGVVLFPAGLLVGAAIIGGFVLALAIAGHARFTGGNTSGNPFTLANELLVPWLTAVGEELLFRALLFRILEEMLGTLAAVVLSALLFGLSHAANPGADPAALGALSLGMGCMMALGYAATRNLWFPIGLHMGWNLAEGFLFGLPDSGMPDPLQVVRTITTGPALLTGGAFGPEGSIVLVLLCALASTILLWATHRRQRWVGARLLPRGTPPGKARPM